MPLNEGEVLALEFEQNSDLLLDRSSGLFPVPLGFGPKKGGGTILG
jgi:hypothetical protein